MCKPVRLCQIISAFLLMFLMNMTVQAADMDIPYGMESGKSMVIYNTADEQSFTVIIPKKILLDRNKTASYDITVKGDVAQGSNVKVEPVDEVPDREGINFVMASAKSGETSPVDVVQDIVYWDYDDITAFGNRGTAKSGSIDGNGLTLGIWNGELTFLINFEDEYADPGPSPDLIGNIEDWEYLLNDTDNIITLTKYIGENRNVVVYPYYNSGVKNYKTKLISPAIGLVNGNTQIQSFTVMPDIDTSNVTDTSYMFSGCSGLISVDLSNFDVSNVTDMTYMFNGCSGLNALNLSNFNTSNVTDMTHMFFGCRNLISLDLSSFNTSYVADMSYMFNECENLESLNLSGFDTSNVTDMKNMFYMCRSLPALDLSNFYTPNVTSMYHMFHGCVKLSSLNLSNFDTSNVTNMGGMFSYCSSLRDADTSGFYTGNVTDMSNMFAGCLSLSPINVSGFNTSNVTDMSYMFKDCRQAVLLDVSGFNTANVTDMKYMFAQCLNLPSLNLSGFDTANVTDMSHMFEDCKSMTALNVSGFDTSNTADMSYMFNLCSILPELDLSSFDTSSAADMSYMFCDSPGLTAVYVDSLKWDTNGSDTTGMFDRCSIGSVTPIDG